MKPQRAIRAAGRAAEHCEALFGQRREPADPLPEFERLGDRLARALGPALAAFGGGKAPAVRLAGVERKTGNDLAGEIGKLAANCLLTAGGKHRLLLSIDGAALLAQLDRAFGGSGDIGKSLPTALPLSADLLAQRIEQAIAPLIARHMGSPDALEIVERDGSFAALAPFKRNDVLAVASFEVSDGDGKPMRILLAAKLDSLPTILPAREPRRRASERMPGPLDAPFADVPLTLEAVLTEMVVPLSRIAALAPGQTLPIAVARAVPLRAGGAIVARGTVGELDDRVALQITHPLHSRKEDQ